VVCVPALTSLPDRIADAGGATLAAVIGMMSARPAAKPLHPRGRTHGARLRHEVPERPTGVPWLDTPGDEQVLARVSRAVGLPAGLPDIQGIALRVPVEDDGHGDVLFASTGLGAATRFLLTPARSAEGRPLTTLLPYRTVRGPLLLALDPVAEGRFRLLVSGAIGPWAIAGELVLGEPDGDDLVSFDPVHNEIPGLGNYGWVRRLREPSYSLARRRRGE